MRDNYTFSLLLGVAEAYDRKHKIKGLDLNDFESENFWPQAAKYCEGIASMIEASMWVYFNEEVSKEYGRKFR